VVVLLIKKRLKVVEELSICNENLRSELGYILACLLLLIALQYYFLINCYFKKP